MATTKRTVSGLASKLLGNARSRAKRKGLEFTLTKDWVIGKLNAGICELSGLPLEIAQAGTANSPSLDRRDNSKGYTPDNCQLITVQANRAKSIEMKVRFRPQADVRSITRISRRSMLVIARSSSFA